MVFPSYKFVLKKSSKLVWNMIMTLQSWQARRERKYELGKRGKRGKRGKYHYFSYSLFLIHFFLLPLQEHERDRQNTKQDIRD